MPELARVLTTQAEALEWLGHHGWAMKNLLRAHQLVQEPQSLLEIQRMARRCGLHQLSALSFQQLVRLVPGEWRVYRYEAIRRASLGMYEAARKLVRMSGSSGDGRSAHFVLQGVVELLAGDLYPALEAFQQAAALRPDHYTRALAAVVATLLGKPSRFAPLAGNEDQERLIGALAALALDDAAALEQFAAGWETLPRLSVLERFELGLCRCAALLLQGDDPSDEDLARVAGLSESLPMLAVAHQTSFEGRLTEMIWGARQKKVPLGKAVKLNELLQRLHEVRPPVPGWFTPRQDGEPLPTLFGVPEEA